MTTSILVIVCHPQGRATGLICGETEGDLRRFSVSGVSMSSPLQGVEEDRFVSKS